MADANAPQIEAFVFKFDATIGDGNLRLDADAELEVKDADGALDIDQLVSALNQQESANEESIAEYIRESLFTPLGRGRGGATPARVAELLASSSGVIVTGLRFEHGSINVLGEVTLLLSNEVVREIAKSAIIAVAGKAIQSGVAKGFGYILGHVGVRANRPISNIQVTYVTGPGAQVTINSRTPSSQSSAPPQPTPIPLSLRPLVTLNAINLLVSVVILLAILAYVFRFLPPS